MIATGHGDSTAIPLGLIARADRKIGVTRHTWTGTLIGAGVGLVLGLIAVIGPSYWETPNSDADTGAVAALTVLGGLLGTAVGAMITTEVWQPIDPSAFQTGVSAIDGRHPGVALSLRF
jgi:hypothetical protein